MTADLQHCPEPPEHSKRRWQRSVRLCAPRCSAGSLQAWGRCTRAVRSARVLPPRRTAPPGNSQQIQQAQQKPSEAPDVSPEPPQEQKPPERRSGSAWIPNRNPRRTMCRTGCYHHFSCRILDRTYESVIRDQQTSAVADVIEQVLLRDALYAEGAFRQTSGVELRH